jgi:hypothetical protein
MEGDLVDEHSMMSGHVRPPRVHSCANFECRVPSPHLVESVMWRIDSACKMIKLSKDTHKHREK